MSATTPKRPATAASTVLDRYVDLNQTDQGIVAWRMLQRIELHLRENPKAPLNEAFRVLDEEIADLRAPAAAAKKA